MKLNRRFKIIIFFLMSISLISFVIFLKDAQTTSKPNILLITIDALRADHLGCYGYGRDASPNIDKLAKEGVVFLNCFTTSSATVYSFPGILTGRYLEIGRDNVFFDNILDKKFITLAEYLKDAGYYTLAFINNSHLRTGKGFEQGIDYYRNNSDKDAEKITADVLKFLNIYKGNKPFFIWIHYPDCHTPYLPKEKYFKIFENDKLYKQSDRILELIPGIYTNPFTSKGYIPKIAFHKDRYSLNYYIACYDAQILYTDFYIGKLLENIKDNALIVLTADHGESLGEHNRYFAHGENIYDEVLRVPLIIKDNQYFKGGKRISTIVSSIDIVPTVLSRINHISYLFNKSRFNGIDLNKIVTPTINILGMGVKSNYMKRKYIYSYLPWAKSIRDINKNIKYILNRDGRAELYFLLDESANHINDESQKVVSIKEELRKNLKTWLKNYPIPADTNSKKAFLDKETRDLLRSLGYLQ